MNRLFNYFITILIIITLIVIFIVGDYYIYLKGMLWAITTIIMLFVGIYLSFKNNFIQLDIKKLGKSIFNKNIIRTMESLSVTLGAKIGVGSLAGVALAIYIGGPGTIFWLWVSSIIISINTYAEAYLSVKYNGDKVKYKGPSQYIYKGLNNKYLAILYSVIIIVAYVMGFIPIQANTIVKSVASVVNIKVDIIILMLMIIISFILFKSTRFIVKLCTILVPFMTILYLGLGLYIIINNIGMIPSILLIILEDALTIRKFIISIIIIGIQRGIFATEAGIGISALSTDIREKDARMVGLAQVLGIHITTFVICTITAFIILTSNYNTLILDNINGIELVTYAFNFHLGSIGSLILVIITLLFAISTVVSGYYYGEICLKNIFPKIKKIFILLFKILTLGLVFIGCVSNSKMIWSTIDILIAFLAIINLYAIWKLRDKVRGE